MEHHTTPTASLKIALAQINPTIGDLAGNFQKHIERIEEAKASGADMVVFPELSLTGYPPKDLLHIPAFLEQVESRIEALRLLSNDIGIIVGAPLQRFHVNRQVLYNAAVYLYQGVAHEHYKMLLPTYDVFDEARYFFPSPSVQCIQHEGTTIALTICEDIWNQGLAPLYDTEPMAQLQVEKPELLINISASPYSHGHALSRLKVLYANQEAYQIPIVYVNQVGAQTELLFDGASSFLDTSGNITYLPIAEENLTVVDVFAPSQQGRPIQEVYEANQKDIEHERMYALLQMGIRDFFAKNKMSKAIIGMSGGIDSAVILALLVKVLGRENVTAVMMPSQYSSAGSVNHSVEMCNRLGCGQMFFPIKDLMAQFESSFSQSVNQELKGLAEENTQARVRGNILMAISNSGASLVVNTSNKSELAVGYSTMYGDSIGALSPIGDLYKTQVYDLARYINKVEGDWIPLEIIEKAPSAELSPGQKDEDSLPPYSMLDPILYQLVDQELGVDAVTESGYEYNLVLRIAQMVSRAEYKRFQFPPILRISSKAFGSGRRIPLVGKTLQ